jgi:hypothetical protein
MVNHREEKHADKPIWSVLLKSSVLTSITAATTTPTTTKDSQASPEPTGLAPSSSFPKTPALAQAEAHSSVPKHSPHSHAHSHDVKLKQKAVVGLENFLTQGEEYMRGMLQDAGVRTIDMLCKTSTGIVDMSTFTRK